MPPEPVGERAGGPIGEEFDDPPLFVIEQDGAVAERDVVVDGRGREHGPMGGSVGRLVESALDSGLAGVKPASEDGLHLKSSVGSGRVGSIYFHKPRKLLRISSFLEIEAENLAEITLG
jgi:hypothetical protein